MVQRLGKTMDNNAINKNMDTKTQQTVTRKQPDERGSFHVQGHIKIFDPETKEVFVQERA